MNCSSRTQTTPQSLKLYFQKAERVQRIARWIPSAMHDRNACVWILISAEPCTIARAITSPGHLHSYYWHRFIKARLYTIRSGLKHLNVSVLKYHFYSKSPKNLCVQCAIILGYGMPSKYHFQMTTSSLQQNSNRADDRNMTRKGHQHPFKNIKSKVSTGVEGLARSTNFNAFPSPFCYFSNDVSPPVCSGTSLAPWLALAADNAQKCS